jgi:ribosomal protein L16/L10AE
VRLTAKQLTTAEEAIKRKIKVIKGSKVYMRVFPHIPVCVKVCPLTQPTSYSPSRSIGKRNSHG